jgi:hypothetical protein
MILLVGSQILDHSYTTNMALLSTLVLLNYDEFFTVATIISSTFHCHQIRVYLRDELDCSNTVAYDLSTNYNNLITFSILFVCNFIVA